MEKVLTAISNLVAELGELRSWITEASREIAARNEKLDLAKIEQDTRAAELEKREAAVKKIEDIVRLKTEAQALIARADEASAALARKQEAFQDACTKKLAELSAQETRNRQAAANNESEAKALIKTREELEKDKAAYKDKVLAEIKAKIK